MKEQFYLFDKTLLAKPKNLSTFLKTVHEWFKYIYKMYVKIIYVQTNSIDDLSTYLNVTIFIIHDTKLYHTIIVYVISNDIIIDMLVCERAVLFIL